MSELRLAGAVVGVTANHRRHDQQAMLERHGATVIAAPMFRSALAADSDVLEYAVQSLVERPPDVTVLTTAFGTRSWFDVADAAGHGDALRAALGATAVLARGDRTAGEAVACGLDPMLVETLTHSSDVTDRLHAHGHDALTERLSARDVSLSPDAPTFIVAPHRGSTPPVRLPNAVREPALLGDAAPACAGGWGRRGVRAAATPGAGYSQRPTNTMRPTSRAG